jgi:hypothetical protein
LIVFSFQLILFLIDNQLFERRIQSLRVFKDDQAVGVVDPSYFFDVVLRYTIFLEAETFTNILSLQVVNSIDHHCHLESLSSWFGEIRLNLRVEMVSADIKAGSFFDKVENLLFGFLLFDGPSTRKFGLNDSLHQREAVIE